MRAPRRTAFGAFLACACLLAVLPVTAQTVLLVVREKANGQPLPPPFAVREGLSGSLFDAGIIVLDAPGTAAVPAVGELARLARAAGADVVLQCSAEYSETSLGADLVRVSARAAYALIDSTTGAFLAQGSLEATNKDREPGVRRAALGGEIGRDLALIVRKKLASVPGPA